MKKPIVSTLPRLLSLPDAARVTGLPARRLYALVRARVVEHVRLPGNGRVRTNIYFQEADLQALLDAATVRPKVMRPTAPRPAPLGLSVEEECAEFGISPNDAFL